MYIQGRGFNSFAGNMTKLSVDKTKWTGMLGSAYALYSIDFDLNIWFWAQNITRILRNRSQVRNRVAVHLIQVLLMSYAYLSTFFQVYFELFPSVIKKNIIYQVPWQESFMAQQTGYSLAYLILTCSLKHWPSIWQTIFYSCYFLVGKSQFQWVINLIRFNMDIENKIRKISHLTSKVLYLYKAMFCFEGTFMLKNCWKLKFISWKKIINRWKV